MSQGYVLEWLDRLITISLNPLKTDLSTVVEVQGNKIKRRIEEEKLKLKTFLKDMIFGIGEEYKTRALVKKYHSSLILLLDQALENRMKCPAKLPELNLLADDVVTCVDEMLSFIEKRFSEYLNPDDPIPATYCDVVIKEIKKKLDKVKRDLVEGKNDKDIMKVVFFSLHSYLRRMLRDHSMSFGDVFYLKELCNELEDLNNTEGTNSSIYTPFDRLLICMNFNDKQYMDIIIKRLIQETNKHQGIPGKLEVLLLNFKVFKQIPLKPGVIFNPHCRRLDEILGNWFLQEISYLEEKRQLFISDSKEVQNQAITRKKLKVRCILSTDQMGIILRAADELKVLSARSLNEVFRSIVPHLSTPHKENLSYDSMRSKSYSIETKDKEIAIETLQKMIEKIKEY